MPPVVKGTKDARKQQPSQARVVKGSSDPRQCRCSKCHGLAMQVPDGEGGTTYKCQTCGAKFNFTAI